MSTISREEQAKRAEEARQFRHSTEMEGGSIPEEAQADIAAYGRGEIDGDEIIRRARERFGLDPQ